MAGKVDVIDKNNSMVRSMNAEEGKYEVKREDNKSEAESLSLVMKTEEDGRRLEDGRTSEDRYDEHWRAAPLPQEDIALSLLRLLGGRETLETGPETGQQCSSTVVCL